MWIYLVFLSFLPLRVEALSLKEYLDLVRTANPEIAVETAKQEQALQRDFGIQLPAPMIAISKMNEMGQERYAWELSQSLPFPSKLRVDAKVRELESESAKYFLKNKIFNILEKSKQEYFLWWKNSEQKNILLEKRKILKDYQARLDAADRFDATMKIHSMDTRLEIEIFDVELIDLENTIRQNILNLEYLSGGQKALGLEKPEEPKDISQDLIFDPEQNSQIKAQDLKISALRQNQEFAEQAWLPNFTFKFRDAPSYDMKRRSQEFMVGIDLPFLFFWQTQAEKNVAIAKTLEAEKELAQIRLEKKTEFLASVNRAKSLQNQIQHIESRIIPVAEKRLKVVHGLALRDMEGLSDHKNSLELLPNLRSKLLNLKVEYFNTLAKLAVIKQREL